MTYRFSKSLLSFTVVDVPFVNITQSCLTLCNRMGCSLPGSSVHGILQARILEWVAISFSRAGSQLRDQTNSSCIGRQIL